MKNKPLIPFVTEEKEKSKNKPLKMGIFAVCSPLPLVFFTMFWFMFLWGILSILGVFSRYGTMPEWALCVGLLPLSISPLLGVAGIIHGIVKMKERLSWLGIVLSVLGLPENFGLIYVMGYIGSRF